MAASLLAFPPKLGQSTAKQHGCLNVDRDCPSFDAFQFNFVLKGQKPVERASQYKGNLVKGLKFAKSILQHGPSSVTD